MYISSHKDLLPREDLNRVNYDKLLCCKTFIFFVLCLDVCFILYHVKQQLVHGKYIASLDTWNNKEVEKREIKLLSS